ncbi:MAG: FtsX-like permease family protein [Candidatus Saccharimonadales bacterium]
MNTFTRGVRNAFRNQVRTFSIVVILGLSIGLALAMLLAHQAVEQKITSVKSSVGNTITIAPAGFSAFSQANNALTTNSLSKVGSLAHVTKLTETLTDRLTTIGSAQPSFSFGSNSTSSNSNNQTSLTSPVTLNSGSSGSAGGAGPRLFVSGGGSLPSNFSPPITILGTNDPTAVEGNAITISSGKTISGSNDTNNALVSTNMASKNSLKVGSTFSAYGTNLTVAGIFKASTEGANNDIVVSLPTEQRLSGQSGDVTNAVATVDSLDNLSATTTAVKNLLGSSADVESAQDQANATVQPLQSIKSVSLYSLIGAVIAGAVIILLTMIMIVRERRREIGVIKAIGSSNLKVVLQFMTEAVTLTVLGTVIGIVLGVVAADPITRTLVNNSTSSSTSVPAGAVLQTGGGQAIQRFAGAGGSTNFVTRGRGLGVFRSNISNIHAAVGWSIILYGLAAAIAIAILGSVVASWFIAKVRPAEVMRAE